ncbi:MAG: aminotransferase class III-fold pyridoxal phosphate-dependent enzyme, partial [Burkholderiaceae bacterium]|nr:aminotransferase class III-fold pyridoxal phosphate-dependent enzyme [Burkholderiaceae bacterium]
LLVKAGSGLATLGHPTSAGVPPAVVQDTLVLEYNNIVQLEAAFDEHGRAIAGLIMEPIAGNMNFVRASVEFTRRCQQLCRRYGALFIYDEVMTGCRVALGGAQSLYARQIPDFSPDITMLGKVIGGGMPLAAFGGKRAVMEQLAPIGPVYQAGTLAGNPAATACGLATLHEIAKPDFFGQLSAKTRALADGFKAAADRAGVPLTVDCEGGMFGFFLRPELPRNYGQVLQSDAEGFKRLFHGLLARGIYTAPSPYEAGFVSITHDAETLQVTLDAATAAFAAL